MDTHYRVVLKRMQHPCTLFMIHIRLWCLTQYEVVIVLFQFLKPLVFRCHARLAAERTMVQVSDYAVSHVISELRHDYSEMSLNWLIEISFA